MIRGLVPALLVALLATGCTAAYDDDGEARSSGRMAPAPAKAPDAVPVVIDSDLAPDDLVAITYLVRHPRVRVLGITVPSTGMVTPVIAPVTGSCGPVPDTNISPTAFTAWL